MRIGQMSLIPFMMLANFFNGLLMFASPTVATAAGAAVVGAAVVGPVAGSVAGPAALSVGFGVAIYTLHNFIIS